MGTLTLCTWACGGSLACCSTEESRWAGKTPAQVLCPSLYIPSANWAGPLPGVLGARGAEMASRAEVTKGEALLEKEGPVVALKLRTRGSSPLGSLLVLLNPSLRKTASLSQPLQLSYS